MPAIKLYYFNLRGRAEPCRLILAAAGEKYEDIRLEGEKWVEFKPKTPLGQLPVLEIDGTMLAQSITSARYLAKKFNMYGKDDLQQAKGDMVVDTISDTMTGLTQAVFTKDEKEKEEKLKVWGTEKLPPALANLEKMCEKDGKFLSFGLSWADLIFFNACSNFLPFNINWEDYPKLAAVNKKVGDNPKIKEWVAKRPETSF